MQNPTVALAESAIKAPLSTAVVLDGHVITYEKLDGLVWSVSHWLRGTGVQPGMVVGLLLRDQISLLIAMLALMRMGATAFPLSPNAAWPQLQEALNSARSGLLVSDMSVPCGPEIKCVSFTGALATSAPVERTKIYQDPDAICLLVSGSGSTGKPRLIPISHRIMAARGQMFRDVWKLTASERVMVLSPLHFATPTYRILAALSTGATGILWDGGLLTPSRIMEQSPDILHLSVFHAEQLIEQKRMSDPADFSSLRIVSIGASTVTESLRSSLKDDLRARLHVNYGTNETLTIAFARPEDLASAPGSVGRPPQGVEVEILDGKKRPLGPGQIGQLRVKSPVQITSYFLEEDQERFEEGWFYPGDLAKWTEDGQIVHCGRSDHMMIMNGINIFPAEIERVLEVHPAVREVVAFPFLHQVMQNVPVAAVVPQPGQSVTRSELLSLARAHLGARAPRVVALVDAIPRNEQGKPQRKELLKLVRMALAEKGDASMPTSHTVVRQTADNDVRLKQRQIRIDLHFKPPEEMDFEAIDAWFGILNPDLAEAARAIKAPSPNRRTAKVVAWVDRVLLLAREILQVAGIPVFDRPRMLACAPAIDGNGGWRTGISIAAIEYAPKDLYRIAFNAALRAMSDMVGLTQSANMRDEIFGRLIREGIDPLRKLARGGKSTLPLLRAAHRQGVPFYALGAGIYQLGQGAKARRVDRATTDHDTALGQKLSGSKALCAHALRLAGLPGAVNGTAGNIEAAHALAERIGWPVVVKPDDRERGEGVSVDVDPSTLESAFQEAQGFSQRNAVIVEQQVRGVCHRLFVASGRLLYAVKRLPIGVYGDGKKTIDALVSDKLAAQALLPPWYRSELKPLDDLAHTSIASAGFCKTSIPEAGHFIPLRRIETTAWGGIDEDVTNKIHPENQRVALCAADLFGLDVAGVDIISTDISKPWHVNDAIINEVNFSPLLGGGEISRSYIGEYLSGMLDGDGCIPLEVFIGQEPAWRAALERRTSLGGDGAGIFITRADLTLDGEGMEIPMPFISLDKRARALLISRKVKALMLVVDDTEALKTGFPVGKVDAVFDTGCALCQSQDRSLNADQKQARSVRRLLANLF